jgi:hypothetical protein
MKPLFVTLWSNYPSARDVPRETLFADIGWESLASNPAYENTCAIRLSCPLQASGVLVSSSAGMMALKGPLKGKPIEIRQDRLAEQLKVMLGIPEVLPAANTEAALGDRNGVIAVERIPGYEVGGGLGGHIDVVDGRSFGSVPFLFFWERNVDLPSICGSGCYWNAGKIWFWELA